MLSLHRNIENKTIIISPLNWGLGHASRIIPLINELRNKNKIIIAGEPPSLTFLKKRFSGITFFETKNITFSFHNNFFKINNLVKFYSTLVNSIENDKRTATELAVNFKADMIISDNRYGFYSEHTENIIITHQLMLKTPWGKVFDEISRIITKKFLSPFDEIWIPDNSKINLSGQLSKNHFGSKAKYIGILSRFCDTEHITHSQPSKYEYCILLSGPEPARSIVEKRIITFLQSTNKKCIIIAGNTHQNINFSNGLITYLSIADDNEILEAINTSEKIITTAGYSTIMDLYCLKRNAILIPTPKHTEQEYLAKYLSKRCPKQFSTL